MASDELADILAALRADPYRDDHTIAELRAKTARRIGQALPAGTSIDEFEVAGVPVEWVSGPGARTDRTFMFIHGGGYYRGAPASSRGVAAQLSIATGARVLSTGYRLAPEHPFPAAVDDVVSVYRWLLAQDVDPNSTVVGGISAGGGLTLSVALAQMAEGRPIPAGLVPLSPWTDLTQAGDTYASIADRDPVISKAYLDRMAALYLVDVDPTTPLASPFFGDLSGLPPTLIQVGSAETMLDDSRNFATRATDAGVAVALEVWDDMIHGWHVHAPGLPQAEQALARIGDFFREQTD